MSALDPSPATAHAAGRRRSRVRWWPFLVTAGFVGLFAFMAWPSLVGLYIEEMGVPARGTVVEIRDSEHAVNREPMARWTIDVTTPDGQKVRAECDQRPTPALAAALRVGAEVDVKVLPRWPHRVVVTGVR